MLKYSLSFFYDSQLEGMKVMLIVCMWLFFSRFVVSGLTRGETYVFRVQAINELGLSEESQESAPLTVKAALSQYYHFFGFY